MIYSGSVVYVKQDSVDRAKEILMNTDGVDVFTANHDGSLLVISIEAENESDIERICAEIKTHEEILEIAHHIFNFEEEVEEIVSGEKVPDLDGFFRSSRKNEKIQGM